MNFISFLTHQIWKRCTETLAMWTIAFSLGVILGKVFGITPFTF